MNTPYYTPIYEGIITIIIIIAIIALIDYIHTKQLQRGASRTRPTIYTEPKGFAMHSLNAF